MIAGTHYRSRQWFPRFVVFALLVLSPFVMSAQSDVSVTAEVAGAPQPAPTKVVFKGIASPQAGVTILENGSIKSTTVASPTARFDVEITVSVGGTYNYTLYSEDIQGRTSKSSNFTISVTAGTTTTISGIFLSPTISSDKTLVKFGDTISILGATAPASSVTVIVSSGDEKTFSTTAGSDGLWVLQLIADNLGAGDHAAHAKATAPTNEISTFSNTINFTVESVAPNPCTGKTPGDINCDGKVNLSDFSILLFFWKKTNPSNARADINANGVVDIRDLSILLFWWTK